MTKTVIGLYRNFETARTVVQELTQAGIPRENISLVAHDADERYAHELETTGQGKDVSAGEGAGIGAIAGAVVGLGAMLIPGVGPVIAAGPLVAALTGAGVGAVAGAATGGIAAGLIQMGVPESDANLYS